MKSKTHRQVSLHDLLAVRSVKEPRVPINMLVPISPFEVLSGGAQLAWTRTMLLETKSCDETNFRRQAIKLAQELRRHLLLAQIFRHHQRFLEVAEQMEKNVYHHLDWIRKHLPPMRSIEDHSQDEFAQTFLEMREKFCAYRRLILPKIATLTRRPS